MTVALLMYHSVARQTTAGFARLTVDPLAFEEQIAALGGAGFAFVTVAEAAERLRRGAPASDPPAVAITIDDGLADAASGAAPALARHGVRATIFVPTAFVGGAAAWLRGDDRRRPLLDWKELEALAGSGIEIGSHGHRHIACDVNPPDLVEADARRSRELLEQTLGRPAPSFAFPFGYGPRPARAAIRQAGFAQAVVVADLVARRGDDLHGLPRLQVGPDLTSDDVLALVRKRSGSATRCWSHAKQRVWTAGRRYAGWGPPEAAAIGSAR